MKHSVNNNANVDGIGNDSIVVNLKDVGLPIANGDLTSSSIPFLTKLNLIKWMVPCISISGVAMGLPLTLTPQLMKDTYGASEEFMMTGLFGGIQGFIAFFYGPVTGALSDRYGRKPVLIFCLFWYSLQYAGYVFSGNNFWGFGIGAALTGYTSGITSLLFAMTVDAVPLHQYAAIPAALSYMMGFFLGGSTLGPIFGTLIGAPYVFWVGLVLCLLSCVVAYYTLPTIKRSGGSSICTSDIRQRVPDETSSLVNEDTPTTTKFTEKEQQAFHHDEGEYQRICDSSEGVIIPDVDDDFLLQQICREIKSSFTRPIALLRRNKTLRIVALQVFLNQLATQMLFGLVMLYLNANFPDFNATDQLYFTMVWELSALVGLFFIVVELKRLIGTLNTLRVGLLFNMLSMLGFAFATKKWQVYSLGLPMGLVATGVYPTAATVIAGVCDPADLGAAQGIGGGGRMLAEGFSPFIFGILLQKFKGSSLPGAPFIIAAFFCFLACALTTELRNLHPALTEGKWIKKTEHKKTKKKKAETPAVKAETNSSGDANNSDSKTVDPSVETRVTPGEENNDSPFLQNDGE